MLERHKVKRGGQDARKHTKSRRGAVSKMLESTQSQDGEPLGPLESTQSQEGEPLARCSKVQGSR